jgi:hypothetical protein
MSLASRLAARDAEITKNSTIDHIIWLETRYRKYDPSQALIDAWFNRDAPWHPFRSMLRHIKALHNKIKRNKEWRQNH